LGCSFRVSGTLEYSLFLLMSCDHLYEVASGMVMYFFESLENLVLRGSEFVFTILLLYIQGWYLKIKWGGCLPCRFSFSLTFVSRSVPLGFRGLLVVVSIFVVLWSLLRKSFGILFFLVFVVLSLIWIWHKYSQTHFCFTLSFYLRWSNLAENLNVTFPWFFISLLVSLTQ